jgi:hypothetical protein
MIPSVCHCCGNIVASCCVVCVRSALAQAAQAVLATLVGLHLTGWLAGAVQML